MSKYTTNVEKDVLQVLKDGIDTVANAVKSTLGPSGKNVMIETLSGPIITKDGVTVARAITLEDKTKNLAASLIKKIAGKTVDEAGDGTTTATLLAQSLFNEGCKVLPYTNNRIQLNKDIERNIGKVIDIIKSQSKEVSIDSDDITNVATISANGDKEMGKTITEAFRLVGKNGIISVEESSNNGYSVEKSEGLQVECGFVHPYFMTDTRKLECEFKNSLVMLFKGEIGSFKEIEKMIGYAFEKGKPIVIFADGFSDNMVEITLTNRMQGKLQICLNKVPGFGHNKDAVYNDISAVTGAFIFGKGDDLSKYIPEASLGVVAKININRNVSKIVSIDNLDKTKFNEVVAQINTMIEETSNKTEKSRLNERLGKLLGGVAIITVGGATAIEIHEKKDRVDDAVCATRAALEEGILPGGGATLYRASLKLEDDGTEGYRVVREALKSPLKTLCSNCGLSFEYVDALLKNQNHSDAGLDFSKSNYELVDLMKNGIIDPTKVTRVALESASSVVGLLLTTDYTITLNEILDQDNIV